MATSNYGRRVGMAPNPLRAEIQARATSANLVEER